MTRSPATARDGAAGRAGQGDPAARPGRLDRPPHPVLKELLYDPQLARDREVYLPHLLAADAAHVIMLGRRRLLAPAAVGELLALNRELAGRWAAGEALFAAASEHRGLYFLYERELVLRLGREVGGAAHLGRSRNDLQAAVARLRLRQELLDLLDTADELLATLAALAAAHAATVMSGFTHLEPAQPTSLGHYFAAGLAELLRSAEALSAAYALVNRSPLGAAAGFGTTFAIDPELVAELLGFEGVVANSLDAVASRDYVLAVLSSLAATGICLTRIATDLQTWASAAYRFLGWPDELVSTSSIMPQKRNAFVLENLRGRAIEPVGALVNALTGMKNVPFSNSVEVGGEAASHLWPALARLGEALSLATLLLANLEVDSGRMRRFLAGRQTGMTALANHLVERHGLAFRTAHEVVGRLVRELPPDDEPAPAEVKARLAAELAAAGLAGLALDERELARALDPVAGLAAARHGGGPAPESVRRQVEELEEARRRLAGTASARRRALAAAEVLRRAAAEELCRAARGDGGA
jgi:argininosuccinate lyase